MNDKRRDNSYTMLLIGMAVLNVVTAFGFLILTVALSR